MNSKIRVKKEFKHVHIYWPVFIILIILIVGFSCMLIIYFKIFYKWDKAAVLESEILDDHPGSATITYEVSGQTYKTVLHYWTSSSVPDAGSHREYYIDYLVSDPSYVIHDRTTACIIFASADILLVIIFIPAMKSWENHNTKNINRVEGKK